jgi:hypothetical protein
MFMKNCSISDLDPFDQDSHQGFPMNLDPGVGFLSTKDRKLFTVEIKTLISLPQLRLS